jgi:hypothetical protein
MRIADVAVDKPIVFLSQSASDLRAINPLVAFYVHGRKGETLFFCSAIDTTRDQEYNLYSMGLLFKSQCFAARVVAPSFASVKTLWIVLKI